MSAGFESRRQRRQAEALPEVSVAPVAQPSVAPQSLPYPDSADFQTRPSALEALLAMNSVAVAQPAPQVPVLPSVQDRVEQLLRSSQPLAQPAPTPAPASPSPPALGSPGEVGSATLSRREMRQQQAAQVQPESFQPPVAPYSAVSYVPAAASYVPAPVVPAPAPVAPAPAPAPVASRRDLRDQLREPVAPAEVSATQYVTPSNEPSSTSMFQTSSGFSLDTTTNSIVLPVMPDALSATLITDSGVTLKTGSIPLPNLNSGTGSIALPAAAQIADDAQRLDSQTSFVSSISPVAAKNLLKHNPRLGFAPVKTKGTQGQLFYALTTSFLMLTVGGLMLVAWMYGFIK